MPEDQFDFLTKERLLDNLKADPSPAPEVVDVVARLLREEDYARYFFHDLENEAWLSPLAEHGIFDRAPSPVPADGGCRYPQWPAATYLRRVAPKCPVVVVNVLKRVESDNPVTCSDLIEVLWGMPPRIAAKATPAVLRWLQLPVDLFLSTRLAGLLEHLAEGRQWKAAARLLDAALAPESPSPVESEGQTFTPEVRSKRDSYQIEELLRNMPQLFANGELTRLLRVLERRLNETLRIETRSRSDYSSIWRPAVEEHEQNRSGSYKSQFVSAIRDTLERIPDSSPHLQEILVKYAGSRRSIFRRLALHRASIGGLALRELRRTLLMDPRIGTDIQCHHELYLLRAQRFSDLRRRDRTALIQRLTTPPKRKATEDSIDYQLRCEATFIRRLRPIRKWLPHDLQERYDALLQAHGGSDHPEFLSYMTVGWVSDTGPKTADELNRMAVSDVVQLLQEWVPGDISQRGYLVDESRLAFAGELQAAIRAQPARFIDSMGLFIVAGLHGLYVQHLLDGIREAVADGHVVDWRNIFDFCHQLLASGLARFDSLGEHGNESRGSWISSAVSRLIEEAYKSDVASPPMDLWEKTEDLFETLARDPEPDEEYESRYGGSNMDPFTLSLNTARGRAMHGIFSFIRRVALTENQSGTAGMRTMRPLTRRLLEDKLNKSVDKSLAVHSVFGVHLPLLLYADREWTLASLPRIFRSSPRFWRAAFESHIKYSQFQIPVYTLIDSEYRRAIEEAGGASAEAADASSFEEQLGKHMALVFWHGVEDIGDRGSNLALFFERCSDDARSSFVWLIWRALVEAKPAKDSDQWRRCKRLWDQRVSVAVSSTDRDAIKREMSSYAWWLSSTPEDVESMRSAILAIYPYLDRWAHTGDIIEYLDSQAEANPRVTSELLRELIVSGPELYILTEHRSRVRHMLKVALTSSTHDANANALAIINHYERLGDYTYRDLI